MPDSQSKQQPVSTPAPDDPSGRSKVSNFEKFCAYGFHFLFLLLLVYQSAVCVSYYLSNQFYLNDIGQIDYMLYHTWRGRFFWSIIYESSHFAKHFTPTLLLLVPLRAVFSHVLFVPLLECAALVSGGWAVAWMTAGIGKQSGLVSDGWNKLLGLGLGWLYLCSPLTGSILLAWHFESFAVALNLWALAAWIHQRKKLFWVFLILAIGCKEDIGLYWFCFAGWWIVFGAKLQPESTWRMRLRPALILGLVSVVAVAVAMIAIRIFASHADQPISAYDYRYAYLGEDLSTRIINLLKNPQQLFIPPLNIAWINLKSFILLPLFAPSTLLLLIPGAYLFGLSDEDSQRLIFYYYSYPFAPFMCLGAALGAHRLIQWIGRWYAPARICRILTWVCFIAGWALLFQPTRTEGQRRVVQHPLKRHSIIRETIREKVPPEASVCAQYDLVCQVPVRGNLLPFSADNWRRCEYLLLDFFPGAHRGAVPAEVYRQTLRELDEMFKNGEAQQLYFQDGFLIVRFRQFQSDPFQP